MVHVTLPLDVPAPGTTVYRVPISVVDATLSHVQAYGEQGREAICFWIGKYEPPTASVRTIWIPRFECSAVSYDVDPLEMLRLRQELDSSAEVLLAQIHSHPSSAFHSRRDDANSASPWPGFVSIVVPDCGFLSVPFFDAVAIFEHITGTQWKPITRDERLSRFIVL